MSIVIIDDHPLTGLGLATIVASRPQLRVVAGPASLDAVAALDVSEVDVCILGLSGPAIVDHDALRTVRGKWPTARVLVIAEHNDDTHLESLIRQDGVSGFVSKRATAVAIADTVERLARGECYFHLDTALPHRSPISNTASITPKEMDILRMLERGLTVTAIAAITERSVKTTSSHKVSLQKKLGAKSTAQIVPIARALGLI